MVLAHDINDINRTEDVQINQDVTFDTMLLSSNTLNGLKDSGFYKPSPIQLHGIPLGKCGFDLLLEAKSGTGKTAVFTVIALEKIDLKKGLQVVILAPTREIAAQICDVLRQIGSHYHGLRIEAVMGGLPVQDDIEKFKNKVHVVVGSPGRLKHLIQDKHINVLAVRLLVLDEADKLMEKSFLSDIKNIHMVLPRQKQVILSSATYPEAIKEHIAQFVHDPQYLCPNNNCVLLGVVQKITTVKYNSNIIRQTEFRFQELLKILTKKQFKQCLVFCNYQARISEVHKYLTKEKWPSEMLYGQQDQTDRLDALKTLQEYKCRILISTDLAARGIDASNVDLVVNFEPPYEWQTYLHRIGRAGRFGSYGMAITILSEGTEHKKFMNLLDSIKVSKLEYLWSDNVINEPRNEKLDGSESIVSQNTKCNDAAYKELWNVICGDVNNINRDNEKVESFDELLNSLQHSKVNPSSQRENESFSSLLNSFNDSELPLAETNVEYQNITIPKEYGENFNLFFGSKRDKFEEKDLTHVPKKNIEIKGGNCNISGVKQVLNEELGGNNNLDVTCDVNFNCIGNLKCEKRDLLKSSQCDVENTKFTSCNVDELKSKNIEFDRLQLPTAFSNGKNRYIEKINPKKEKFLPKKINLNENQLKYNEKDICSGKNISKIKKSVEPLNHNKHLQCNDITNCNSKYLKTSKKSNKENHLYKVNNNKNQSYEHWYAQLKFRVKYLELALYIDELSKM